jgi:hypothetical protein
MNASNPTPGALVPTAAEKIYQIFQILKFNAALDTQSSGADSAAGTVLGDVAGTLACYLGAKKTYALK